MTLELHLTSHCIFLWKMDIIPTWGFLWLMYNNVLKHLVQGEGIVREFGVDVHTLLYLKWIAELYSML